jgi:hypothetical protein
MTAQLQKMQRQTIWNATVESHRIAILALGTGPTVLTSMTQSVMGLSTDRSLEEGTLAEETSLDISIWISLPPRMAFITSCLPAGLEAPVELLPLRLLISRCGIVYNALMMKNFDVDYLSVKLGLSGGNELLNARAGFYNRLFKIHSSSNWRDVSFTGILPLCTTMVMIVPRTVAWTIQIDSIINIWLAPFLILWILVYSYYLLVFGDSRLACRCCSYNQPDSD